MDKHDEIDNRSIGKRIREEREKLELSREEFAELVGLSAYYVGQLERGERQMSLPAIVKVSNRLHVTLDYLILGKTAYDVYESCDDTEMVGLLEKSSPKELELIKKLIKTILPYL